MGRPKFPNFPITPEMISRIRENQEVYDRDPEGWERREKRREEDQRQEEQALEEECQRQEERES